MSRFAFGVKQVGDKKEKKEIATVEAAEILKLHKQTEIDGKMVSEIPYDFDSVTGDAIETACKELTKSGNVILAQETDPVFHAHLFANAADIDYSDVKRLCGKDYLKATTLVRDFFYMNSAESLEEESSEE